MFCHMYSIIFLINFSTVWYSCVESVPLLSCLSNYCITETNDVILSSAFHLNVTVLLYSIKG